MLYLPLMALEAGTQSDGLKLLGVSYPQFLDYSSKEYIATLVSPDPLMTCRHDGSTLTGVGSSLHFDNDNVGLCHHLVCALRPSGPSMADAPHIQ